MVAGTAKTLAKIAGFSLLFLAALVVIIIFFLMISGRPNKDDANYIDMRSGDVSSRQVKIAPGRYHLKRIHSTKMARVEAKHVKGPDTEICIRRTSAITPNKITSDMCEHFDVIGKKSRNTVTLMLGRGNFDLFMSNKARFRRAHINYSVEVRP